MATASVTNTFVNTTTIDAGEVNTNFSDLVTFLNTHVVHKDGSIAMTGALDMGSQKITSLAAATANTDALNRNTGDARYLQQSVTVTNFVPALTAVTTNPTLSDDASHVATGEYAEFENGFFTVWARIVFGTSGVDAGDGQYRVSIPLSLHADLDGIGEFIVGFVQIKDNSSGTYYTGTVEPVTATTARFHLDQMVQSVDNDSPIAWANSDEIYYTILGWKAA